MEQLTKFHSQLFFWLFATPYQRCGGGFPVTWSLLAKQTSITCFHLPLSFLLWFPHLLGRQSLPLAVSLAIRWEASPEFTSVLLITQKPSICEFTLRICSPSLCLSVHEHPNMSKPILTPCSQFTCLHMDAKQADLNKSLLGHLFLSTGMPDNGLLYGLASHAWTEWEAIWMEQHPGRGCPCRPIVSGQIPPKLP